MKILFLIPILLLSACSAAQEQAFLANAPSVVSGGLATADDVLAALAAANQQIGSQSLNATTGLSAANAAYGSLASSDLGTAVTQVFTGLQNLADSIAASNPSATPAQIAQAQSAQIVATQVAVAASSASGTSSLYRIHYSMFTKSLVIECEPKA